MENIKVKLIGTTPEAVVNEAIAAVYDTEPSFQRTLRVIAVKKHLSCAEHITLNFLVDGSSRLELQEHVRHRIASSTVKSTRYTLDKEEDGDLKLEFVKPFLTELSEFQQNELSECLQATETLAFENVKRLKAAKIPNDFIKYCLPESIRTKFVWTINLRSFLNYWELRSAPNAHFEIRYITKLLRDEIERSPESQYVDLILKRMGC